MSAEFFPNYPKKNNIYGIGGFGNYGGMSVGVSCGDNKSRTDMEVNESENTNEARVDIDNNDSEILNLAEKETRVDNQAKGQVSRAWGPIGGWTCFGGHSGPINP